MENLLASFFGSHDYLFIRQAKEWLEIFTGLEGANKYEVLTKGGQRVGLITEESGFFWRLITRWVLKSRRPMKVSIMDDSGKVLLKLKRPFYFFFSDLKIMDGEDNERGYVNQRFSIINKKYTIKNAKDEKVFTIKSPFWRIWTFKVKNKAGDEAGRISKKWGGFLREFFTDADQFGVEFKNAETLENKVLLFSAAVSIDLDYFEENQPNN